VSLRVAVVYPDLLGTYGDGGNGVVRARRAAWRGIEAELIQASSDLALPEADIYCLGGGEDGPQVRAARLLLEEGTLSSRVAEGAVVLAVCAGFQIVGRTFPGPDGGSWDGVGLLDVETHKGDGPRAVGEVVVEPRAVGDSDCGTDGGFVASSLRSLPVLTGFENHGGRSALVEGSGTEALGRVLVGVGNGAGDGSEGARRGRVLGTYLHGPVLARNPALADLLLSWALGGAPLAPLDDTESESLRSERLAAAEVGGRAPRRLPWARRT
jgi:CobQ-like glutamine amidotransferase family enzyme